MLSFVFLKAYIYCIYIMDNIYHIQRKANNACSVSWSLHVFIYIEYLCIAKIINIFCLICKTLSIWITNIIWSLEIEESKFWRTKWLIINRVPVSGSKCHSLYIFHSGILCVLYRYHYSSNWNFKRYVEMLRF